MSFTESLIINPVLHHHFKFNKGLKEHPNFFNSIKFEELPFFLLVKESHRDEARRVFESMRIEMDDHKIQQTYNKINIPKYLEDCCYRAEAFPMIFCEDNNQKFFVRGYYLRSKGFFKIEITFHSDCLSGRKSLYFDKINSSANKIFDKTVPQVFRISPFPNTHLKEYFFTEDFKSWVEQFEHSLKLIKDSHTVLGKRALIEDFKNSISQFEDESKENACSRLLELEKSGVVAQLQRSNSLDLF